ncbi:unnamed protein product [Gordionus sp. m RMFG-2023]
MDYSKKATIQDIRKNSNTLPIWGNDKSMNLNHLILANIQGSSYFKVNLAEMKTFFEVVDEIYYHVTHLEPWEKGSRKTAGQTGMCGGVRGVGAGGVVSSCFCILFKLFTLKLTRRQLCTLINHKDSPHIRGIGFMFIRYCQPPIDLWDWYEPYLDDPEEIDVKAGGGCIMTIGEVIKSYLTKLEWFATLFPRIPVPVQHTIMEKLSHHKPSSTHLSPLQNALNDYNNDNYNIEQSREMKDRENSHYSRQRERDHSNDYCDQDRERDRVRSRSRGRDRSKNRNHREVSLNKDREQSQSSRSHKRSHKRSKSRLTEDRHTKHQKENKESSRKAESFSVTSKAVRLDGADRKMPELEERDSDREMSPLSALKFLLATKAAQTSCLGRAIAPIKNEHIRPTYNSNDLNTVTTFIPKPISSTDTTKKKPKKKKDKKTKKEKEPDNKLEAEESIVKKKKEKKHKKNKATKHKKDKEMENKTNLKEANLDSTSHEEINFRLRPVTSSSIANQQIDDITVQDVSAVKGIEATSTIEDHNISLKLNITLELKRF